MQGPDYVVVARQRKSEIAAWKALHDAPLSHKGLSLFTGLVVRLLYFCFTFVLRMVWKTPLLYFVS